MKTLIVTSYIEKQNQINLSDDYEMIICADAGFERAKVLGITPKYIIGDYDSASTFPSPDDINVIYLPCEKDMTDTEAALNLAIDKGGTDITILGGLGGRFDHTMGNIGLLAGYSTNEVSISIMDGQNHVVLLMPGIHVVKKENYKYVGLISYGEVTKGITLSGFKYPLSDFDLENNTSLCVSNEILEEQGEIKFNSGKLMVIRSKEI